MPHVLHSHVRRIQVWRRRSIPDGHSIETASLTGASSRASYAGSPVQLLFAGRRGNLRVLLEASGRLKIPILACFAALPQLLGISGYLSTVGPSCTKTQLLKQEPSQHPRAPRASLGCPECIIGGARGASVLKLFGQNTRPSPAICIMHPNEPQNHAAGLDIL